jgi:GH15 family glucan-1,4-alpha-glucosidase
MGNLIEDYAMIGNRETAALVSREGSIDWLCAPHFDSAACFSALLGKPEHGRWLIAPDAKISGTSRRYMGKTLVLETEFTTAAGDKVALIDFMPARDRAANVVRIVEGRRGRVPMRMEMTIRFDYGSIVPWVERIPPDNGMAASIWAIGGPDALRVESGVPIENKDFVTTARFEVAEGQRVPFVLTWNPSHGKPPPLEDPWEMLKNTCAWWEEWAAKCTYRGEWHEQVVRSAITLKGLTFEPTGAIVAAATTSLPEEIGGVRNWDYRFCWLRDATLTLYSLMQSGYAEEAKAWGEWLLRAVAGLPGTTKVMYGLGGERRLPELTLDWLPGYEGSKPVRIGNEAAAQFQLDVYGEVIDTLYQATKKGIEPQDNCWHIEQSLIKFVEESWGKPDEGIWEIRSEGRHFTHSKVMCWVAMDRAIKSAQKFGLPGPVDKWKALAAEIHKEVCTRGFDSERNTFVQSYGSKHLDASLLMIPIVGFLPPKDHRVEGTLRAIEHDLLRDGFMERYSEEVDDGLPPGEGTFLACSFWYADNLHLVGRNEEAREVFERLISICNDVGLMAEEYDPEKRRMLGNFPQAFSHVGMINTALNLTPAEHHPAEERGDEPYSRSDD